MVWVGADERGAVAELGAGRLAVLVLPAGATVPPEVAAAATAGKGGRLAVFVDLSRPSGAPAEGDPPAAALELAAELFGS